MIFVNINTSNNIFYSELKGDTYKINHIYMGHRKKDREDSIHNVYIQKI